MAIADKGNIYVPGSPKEILDQVLGDYASLMEAAGVSNPAIQPGTEPYIRFLSTVNAIGGLYYNIAISADNTSELTATGYQLDLIRQAMGLPEVVAAPASGKVTVTQLGSNLIFWADGTEFRTQQGKRGKVNGNQYKLTGATLDVIMIDVGSTSNVDPGSIVEWLAPPVNALAKATVDSNGLTGGVDDESDSEKRNRIIGVRQNPPASGNWGMIKALAEGAHAGIQAAFVYPTLGGPSTFKVVVTKALSLTDPTNFSREVDSSIYNLARDAISAGGSIASGQTITVISGVPDGIKFVVQSVVDQPIDVAFQLALPSPATVGGLSDGWDDSVQFPNLAIGETHVTVTAVTDPTHITVSALGNEPIDGQTIAWWNSATKTFTSSVIGAHSGSAGAWQLGLDSPLTGIAVGDFISAHCDSINNYATTLLEEFNKLGPAENTSDATRLIRAKRKPGVSKGADSFPTDVGGVQLSAIIASADEITDAAYSFKSLDPATPTIPGTVATAPNVFTLRKLAFYPL